jgi:hypothetical protein
MLHGAKCCCLCLLAVVVAGCAAQPEKAVVQVGPTSSPTVRAVTRTALPTVTLADTGTPTVTATATATPRPRRTPRVIDTRTPTPDLTLIALPEAVMTASPGRTIQTRLSPDAAWRADVVVHDCVNVGGVDDNAYEQLTLTRPGTGEVVVADSQLLSCGGVGAYGLDLAFWSPSGRYLYYATGRVGVPDGFCGFWVRGLHRYDVSTGERLVFGEGPRSPDGSRMASWNFTAEQRWELEIRSVEGGVLGKVSPLLPWPETRVGPIAWAPDGQAVAYLQWASACGESGRTTVVVVDLTHMSQMVLLEKDPPGFYTLHWDAPYRIRLWDDAGGQWRYQLLEEVLVRLS